MANVLSFACTFPLPPLSVLSRFTPACLSFCIGALSDGMSDQQFDDWLRKEGMTQSGDREKVIGMTLYVDRGGCNYMSMC